MLEFIQKLISELAPENAREITEMPLLSLPVEVPPDNANGDITINFFKLAKLLKGKPDILAARAAEILSTRPEVLKAEAVKAFLNIEFEPSFLHSSVPGRIDWILAFPEKKGGRVVLEYSAPNTNKPMHLGHVRNNTLGQAVGAILKKAGRELVSVNLINDRGIHICKSMLAYERFGNGELPSEKGKKGDHFVGDFYVLFDAELRRQIAQLKAEDPSLEGLSDDELFSKTEIGAAAQDMLKKWEAGDDRTIALWKKMNKWVIDGFEETYRRMGIKFDKIYLESETYLLGKDIVSEGLARGTFQRRDDGAVYVDLEKEKFGRKVLLRSDGTSVYITQDLGTTVEKAKDFAPDSQIWIVGDEQILHFKTLFAVLAKLGYAWASSLFHLSYGMVNLPSGRMKSREGTVVDADDLFDQMAGLAMEACKERYGDKLPEDIEERCEIIGMGALKFMLLKFSPKTTMTFDPSASLKFEGDTGPYVQYACARINSIMRKADAQGAGISGNMDWSLLSGKEEKQLAIRMLFYPKAVHESADKLDPSILAGYLLELAKAFSRFYKEFPVLSAESQELRCARLALCDATRRILEDGLGLLSIRAPEAM